MCLRRMLFAMVVFVGAANLASADPIVQAIVDQVSQAQYTYWLSEPDFLYTHDGDNRGWGPQHDLARANIFDTLAGYGLSPELDPFTYYGSTYYNVVATMPGTVTPENIYIVGAHYDSVSNPGANDNGSGVSAMLEAARVLSRHQFESTIVLIAFDREEQGLIGSKAYAAEHQNDNILGMISLDMIAYRDPANPTSAYVYSDFVELRAALANAVNTYSGGLTAIERDNEYGTDNWSFDRYDIPNGFLEENFAADPHYHQSTDSVDTPGYIDYAYGTSMAKGAIGWLAECAVPVPIPGDASGDGQVDEADAAILAANWGESGKAWWDGDFNADDQVDMADASIMAANWGRGSGGESIVPEPGVVVVLVGMLCFVLSRRRS